MTGLLLLAGSLAGAPDLPGASFGPDGLSDQALAEQAETAYRAGLAARADIDAARPHFARAAQLYQALRQRGNRAPVLFRDLAQAYLLAGDLGRSIAAYRRGLIEAPHGRALQQGLAYARARVAYPFEGAVAERARPRESWSLSAQLAPAACGAAGVALLFGACLAFARGWMKRQTGWWVIGVVFLAGSAMFLWSAVIEPLRRSSELSERRWGVTVAVEAPFRTGNSTDYPARLDGPLPAGVEVRVLARRGGWVQVRLAGGPVGWVPSASLTVLD